MQSKIHHFKELGLECNCLGPIEKRISDRQSINMHKAANVAAGIAGVAALTATAKKLLSRKD